MGIVNVTPDSFSDGGAYFTVDHAVAHAHELLQRGATILDIGGESTRPGADAITISEEISRVVPVITELRTLGVPLSIDTCHAAVASAALDAGACIINDISGFRDENMVSLAARSNAGLVVMHMQGTPQTMQQDPHYDDVVAEVAQYLSEQADRLVSRGVEPERIMLDPGFGFGKTYAHNLALMRHTNTLVQTGYPVLVGVSRKSMIGALTGYEISRDRDQASAEVGVATVAQGASVLRVHNVEATMDALQLSSTSSPAFLALGSNVGDSLAALGEAIEAIDKLPNTAVVQASHSYSTEPAYELDQPAFCNAVVEVRTSLGPWALLAHLQAIENEMGRVRTLSNGPRTIDLDVLSYGALELHAPSLDIPHPRMLERDFVVTPLLEIAPDFSLPNGAVPSREDAHLGRITQRGPELFKR